MNDGMHVMTKCPNCGDIRNVPVKEVDGEIDGKQFAFCWSCDTDYVIDIGWKPIVIGTYTLSKIGEEAE